MSKTNRILRLRNAQNLSRDGLALRLGVHERTVCRWENGETSIPEKYWAPLSELFGVSVAHMLGLDNGGDPNGDGIRVAA